MLTLILTKKWYDMIASGEKTEEYREIKEYYTKRFQNAGLIDELGCSTYKTADIVFRCGYAKKAPKMLCTCRCWRGKGKEAWGALLSASYYVLTIYNKVVMPCEST